MGITLLSTINLSLHIFTYKPNKENCLEKNTIRFDVIIPTDRQEEIALLRNKVINN